MGDIRTRLYCKGVLEAEGFPLAEVSEHLERPDVTVWVDFCGPDRDQLHELAAELGLHELAVEDALEPHQRPKVDHYATHVFLTCHTVAINIERDGLQVTEIDAFVNHRWLITVRKSDGFSMAPVLERWDRSPDLAALGASYFLYVLLDVVVDSYFDTLQQFDDYYDEVSDELFSERPIEPAGQLHWFHMRRALVRFHRLVVPMRETLNGLLRREQTSVTPELYPYYQDVYDHVLRVTEATDALRDLVATIVETNLSLRDYRQNQVMKKVTSWAAIIAVPTLITGYYGMNVPYPGLGETWGFIVSVVAVVVASVALYLTFRRRGWL